MISKDSFIKKILSNNKLKLKADYFTNSFYDYIINLFFTNSNLNFNCEKDLQHWLKNIIQERLISLEEYDTVIKEKQLINQKRIDLSITLSESTIWIELKNKINWQSMRTLEYQINEYVISWIIYNYIFVIIKLTDKEQEKNKILKYKALLERLNKLNNVIILIV